ncbi:recombinase family protein (plasmid) [Lichenicola cladoniae]|uniref:Recombinase family protein n=1 Tax=Lichenicola cladoniae TaxID=1484109 RepID=A0A6M8HYH5_9PROT|nr:recombinase family protein [Acetobacteraceae bacterium]QKE93306.1 recombinase family protein [Lichenicola cladoniae]
MTIIGYARVSTAGQELHLQFDALRAAGCDRIFEDHGVSGAKAERPGLDDLLGYVGSGDMLTVYKLDRLGRSLPHLLTLVADLDKRGIGFRSLTEMVMAYAAATLCCRSAGERYPIAECSRVRL